MRGKSINPTDHSYAHGYAVEGASRFLFISGQVPEDKDGNIPTSFRDQAHMVWTNIETQLAAADMGLDNLVKVTTYLSNRQYRQTNSEVRHAVLQGRNIAITIIIADIYHEAWLLEIEAIAAA